LYKDSELLIQSNHYSSTIYSIELNITEEYNNLNLYVLYDFNSETINRKIEFMVGEKTIATFEEDKYSRLPFVLPKKEIDKVANDVLDQPVAIHYSDSTGEHGILVGFVIFKRE
jgi:hypothetical protein